MELPFETLVLERRAKFAYHALVSQWITKADRMNKDFFTAHRERPPGTSMRAIRDESGHLQTSPDTVLDIATEYYAQLFSADVCTSEFWRLVSMFGLLRSLEYLTT